MPNPLYPCLWFDGQAAEAAAFYCSVFPHAQILDETPMVVTFELNGGRFMALNGGSQFHFNEATSFVIPCDTQEEIDYYWETLTKDGGEESRCGWLKDKYGLSWQVVPSMIGDWLKNPEKAARMMPLVMTMNKLDLDILRNA